MRGQTAALRLSAGIHKNEYLSPKTHIFLHFSIAKKNK
jgi:hypothetical protein